MENYTELIPGVVYITLPELLASMGPENLCKPKEGMPIRQAAKVRGVAPGTLRRHIKEGKITFKMTVVYGNPEYRIFPPSV